MSAPDPADGCDDERLARAHLSRVAQPGDRSVAGLTGGAAWVDLVAELRRGRGPEVWRARHRRLGGRTVDLVRSAERLGISLVVPGEPTWPTSLDDLTELPVREGPDGGAPLCLWVRGRLPEAETAPWAVAVVGARACTAYGEHVAEDLGASLVDRGWTVVSGAAYGIDAAAHRGALAAAGGAIPPTVAVLAAGVDRSSPAGNADLLRRVVEAGGAVVSELPPGTRPAAYRFLLRNRLIAAWARGVVVVEASLRSGALNTARTASDLSRHVAAVPGPVTSTLSSGTIRLLRDGAACVGDAGDVVELLGAFGVGPLSRAPHEDGDHPPDVSLDRAVEQLGGEAVLVWQALSAAASQGRSRPLATDDVVAEVGLGHRVVTSVLGQLELLGWVERDGPGWRRGGHGTGGPAVFP